MEHLSPHFFASLGARLASMQAQGIDVVRLDEGAPDLPPAPHIIEALVRSAALPDRHSYTPHRGPRVLRDAWAEMYQRLYGVALNPETEILPLLGSKEGIFHLIQAYIGPGDIALTPDPGYVTYIRSTRFGGGDIYPMPLLAERGYLPDLQAIPADVLRRARLLWLNYPNNPTAAVASLSFFEDVVAFARRHNLLLCSDAAYNQVTFDGQPAPSLLQVDGAKDVAVEFNTLSKSHNMAGWRTAALVGNPDVIRTAYTLKTNTDSSHFLPIMEASVSAMTGEQSWLLARNEIYRQRRDAVLHGLRAAGLQAETPQASLYIWSPIPAGWKSIDFTSAVLENAHLSLTPGIVFGPGGEGFVRVSITAPLERIEQAMQRFLAWMEG
jgi:LL-diaminopimelate aminotransferase